MLTAEIDTWRYREPNEDDTPWFVENGIPLPWRIIDPLIIDRRVREDYGYPHPFPGQRSGKWQGCYLFYNADDQRNIVPLYAGRTSNFAIRLHQHWVLGTGWAERAMEDELTATWVALWVLFDERARRQMEHLLIGVLRPRYNVL